VNAGEDRGQIRALPGNNVEHSQARLRELIEGDDPPRALIMLAVSKGGDLLCARYGDATNAELAWAGAYLLRESQT